MQSVSAKVLMMTNASLVLTVRVVLTLRGLGITLESSAVLVCILWESWSGKGL